MNIDRNALMLKELLKKHGNNVCADCGSQGQFFEEMFII
jgi:hypothetical protein